MSSIKYHAERLLHFCKKSFKICLNNFYKARQISARKKNLVHPLFDKKCILSCPSEKDIWPTLFRISHT